MFQAGINPNPLVNPTAAVGEDDAQTQDTSCFQTCVDGMKVGQYIASPCEPPVACMCGVACFMAECFLQAEENSRPATRYEVTHAHQERLQDQRDLDQSFGMGGSLGVCLLRSLGRLVGAACCAPCEVTSTCCGSYPSQTHVVGCFDKATIRALPGVCSQCN